MFHPFVYAEIVGGALMAACFAVMWLLSLYQMWFSMTPSMVRGRNPGDLPLVGTG